LTEAARVSWAGHVTRTGNMRTSHNMKPDRKRSLGSCGEIDLKRKRLWTGFISLWTGTGGRLLGAW